MLKRLPISFLLAASIVAATSFQAMHASFGKRVLSTALGTGIGTAVGNILTTPREKEVHHVVVKEVSVPSEMPARRVRKLERTENKLRAELEELRNHKQLLERRIATLEQELSDTEAAIDVHVQALKNIEEQKKDFYGSRVVTKGEEIAEIEVR
jgi:predicted RNase H-like nuclease (RuvC/YqgF family)